MTPLNAQPTTTTTATATATAAKVTAIQLDAPVPCDGRLLAVPAGQYDWIRLLVAADDPAELDEEVWLHYREGADPEWLRTTGRTTGPADGALRSARVPVPRRSELVGLRLPDRPGLTVHALDVVGPDRAAGLPNGA
ncbi:hypothetical protein ACFQ7F_28705 [Streptomyces sp. NPDC056486]|uniref:hypothetical protein n=1 Tax=Streptomyces sp. NPDC056486 TaxID=3345835 RepID=UPI0036824018